MKRAILCSVMGLASALFGLPGARAASLDVTPTLPVVAAPAGSSVLLEAVITNSTLYPVFIAGVSSDATSAFVGADQFDEFLAAAPDSLLPGESWEGPVIRLTVAPDAPIDSTRLVNVSLGGGDHPYDNQILSTFAFTINDSVAITGVPAGADARLALTLRSSPNPTRGKSEIAFSLPSAGEVDVQVYDVSGRAIRSLVHGFKPAGEHRVQWDSRDANGDLARPGMYFVRLRSSEGVRKTKVVRIE